MSDNMDMPLDGWEQFENEFFLKRKNKMKENKLPNRLYYVASNNIVEGQSNAQWRRATLNEAIAHAQQLMDRDGKDEIYIAKVVRVVRRKPAPVEVITV